MDKKHILFVIGMHRCGTSLLTSCLVRNGYSTGKSKNYVAPNMDESEYEIEYESAFGTGRVHGAAEISVSFESFEVDTLVDWFCCECALYDD